MAATLAEIVVFAALSLASVHFRGARAEPPSPIMCPKETTVVPLEVNAPGATLVLKCTDPCKMKPASTSNSETGIFCDKDCQDEKPLSELCPGATGQKSGEQLTLNFPQLPTNTTTVYLQCTDSTNNCVFAVTVKEAPLQGPQVCAVPGDTIRLVVHGEAGKATFGCGSALTVSPASPAKVYNEDCKKEDDLKDLTRSPSGNYYVLTPTKKPSSKTLCYLCATGVGRGREDCKVLISVSAASRVAAVSTVGLALPSVLTSLYFI